MNQPWALRNIGDIVCNGHLTRFGTPISEGENNMVPIAIQARSRSPTVYAMFPISTQLPKKGGDSMRGSLYAKENSMKK